MNKEVIRDWWTQNPMTYGDTHGQTEYTGKKIELGSLLFFEELDQKFYSWNRPLHDQEPFDRLFPYQEYPPGSCVLEVGCGMGTMAMNWARHGSQITAIDLNPLAVQQTRRRFELYGLKGNVFLGDANQLPFPSNTFDYSYSWEVLHHSPDLIKSIQEMMRVTRDGGGFGIMVYNRRSLLYWYGIRYIEGFLHYEKQFLTALKLASRYTDGAREEGNPYTWPVTSREIKHYVTPFSDDYQIKVFGKDLDALFLLLLPGVGMILPAWVKKVWARRFGWSLWIYGHKRRRDERIKID